MSRKAKQLSWQAVATEVLAQPKLAGLFSHLRRRLDRLRCSLLPGHRVARVMRVRQRIVALCPPRVVAAFIRTVCDGWLTAGRFQSRLRCRFGCRRGRDTLARLMVCPCATRMAVRHSRLRRPPGGSMVDHF